MNADRAATKPCKSFAGYCIYNSMACEQERQGKPLAALVHVQSREKASNFFSVSGLTGRTTATKNVMSINFI